MYKHNIFLLLCGLASCTVALAIGRVFVKTKVSLCGPTRLDIGWTDRSLASCGVNCIKRYQGYCYSFMFHNVTNLCTPGGQLMPLKSGPDEREGDLFVLLSDDAYYGFGLESYMSATVNLAFYQIDVNYTQAIGACQCLNSSLYAAKSLDKFNLYAQLVHGVAHDTWIGMNDLETEGRFVWSDDGQPFNTQWKTNFFQFDQPDNYLNEDCVEMHWDNQKLNDDSCNKTFYFICEKQ
nr:collectin-10-like [Biomphalaria glabrata]